MTQYGPEWLAERAADAHAALTQIPDSHRGPAARLLMAGYDESVDSDAATPHQAVRAFLTERARQALPIPNLDVIASTPAGFGYLPDGSSIDYRYLELTVTAVQALLADNDALRAQLARAQAVDSADFSPGELVLYGLAEQPKNEYSAAEIAMMDTYANDADNTDPPTWAQQMIESGLHIGRSFGSRRHIEDACPCPQEPCGLIAMNRIDPNCEQHALRRAKTIRRSHTPEQCADVTAAAGSPAPLDTGHPLTPEQEPANAWMSREFDRARTRVAQLPVWAKPVVTLPHHATNPPADQ